jgi:hypothetical protein
MLIFAAYHKNQGKPRTKVLIPDTAHGTNPASAALCGFKAVAVKSGPDGVLLPESVAGTDGRGHGRHHDHQSQHPGAVRRQHPSGGRASFTKRVAWSTATAPT